MADGFTYEASWGGVRIDVLSARVSHGRRVALHESPKRDGAATEDGGRRPWDCSLEFLFIDHASPAPGEGDYYERFTEFNALVDEDAVRTLVHPYEGAVRCRIDDFEHSADGESDPVIRCSARFIEENSLPPVFAPGSIARTRASSQEVGAAGIAAQASLDTLEDIDAELADDTTELIDDATTSASDWESTPGLSPRLVATKMATLNTRMNALLVRLDAANNLDRHPIHKQFTLLQYQLRRAAQAFASSTTRIIKINVVEPTPLRVIAADTYGAAQAERRHRELVELNPAVARSALVPRGTTLKAYAPNTVNRRFV